MVEVRFACIDTVEGVMCTLDGEIKYSNSIGICSFFGISQGEHTYSVGKEGYSLVDGRDPFGRPLYESGTTTIEWILIPGHPWPEDQPWTMAFTFEEAVVRIPTTTTIATPDKIATNERFYVSGILYDTDSGAPIPNQPINAYYDGKPLGSATTGVDGDYLIETSIPESGFWAIKAEFPGTPGYAASRSLTDAIVTAEPIAMAIEILGPITLAIALFAYSRM